jgi:hypothetical protein
MVRKVSTEKYVVAGIITFLIFSLGITLGLILDDHRYNIIEEINQEQEVEYRSLQLQYLFLNSFSNYDNCPVLAATLKKAITDLDDSLSKVVVEEEQEKITEVRQQVIRRRYVIDNLRYWLLAKESAQKCELNIVPILYFYSEKCSSCPTQGTILTYYKKIFGEKVLVFPISLDLRSQETMVDIVLTQFGIEKYPTLVIDNKKYEGVVRRDQLKEIICESLVGVEECAT